MLNASCYLLSYLILVVGERGVTLNTCLGLTSELQVVHRAMSRRAVLSAVLDTVLSVPSVNRRRNCGTSNSE